MTETKSTLDRSTDIMSAMTCGMYLISASDGIKDNACIINSAMQITSEPVRIVFALHKRSYTHKLIQKTGSFNLSVLDESVDRDVITRFGYTAGREVNKFENFRDCERSANGIFYLTRGANTLMSFETVALTDWDTHTLFTAKLIFSKVLSSLPSLDYATYHGSL